MLRDDSRRSSVSVRAGRCPEWAGWYGLQCWMLTGLTGAGRGLSLLVRRQAHLVGHCWLALARGRYGTPTGSSAGRWGRAPRSSSGRVKREGVEVQRRCISKFWGMPRAPARLSTLFYKCRILSAFFLHLFTPPSAGNGQKCRNPLQYKDFRGVRGADFQGLLCYGFYPLCYGFYL